MSPDKEIYYENATRKLLATIDKMGLQQTERLRAKNLVLLFRDSFKLPEIRQKTFQVPNEEYVDCSTYDSDNFCRVASLNFSTMMGGTPNWQVRYIGDLWTYGPHHYLMHVPSRTILDLTYDQYTEHGLEIPYDRGHPIPFDFNKDPQAQNFAAALNLASLQTNKQKN